MKTLALFLIVALFFPLHAGAHENYSYLYSESELVSISSDYINCNFTYKENGRTVAYIELRSNGKVTMYDESVGYHYGTYEIIGEIYYSGGSNRIEFNIDGRTYSGMIYFPTSDKWGISFDGLYFTANLR